MVADAPLLGVVIVNNTCPPPACGASVHHKVPPVIAKRGTAGRNPRHQMQ